jgi:hypothetical protein
LFVGGIHREPSPSSISLLLAGVGVAIPAILAAAMATHRLTVKGRQQLAFRTGSLGVMRTRLLVRAEDVRHVCATSPTGSFPKHVVLLTSEGLSSFACAQASRVVGALRGRHP